MSDNRRTAREVAEEVAIDSGERLMAYATPRYHKCLVQPFRNKLADAIERGINKYLEEHR
jgi:hypothetical protein